MQIIKSIKSGKQKKKTNLPMKKKEQVLHMAAALTRPSGNKNSFTLLLLPLLLLQLQHQFRCVKAKCKKF